MSASQSGITNFRARCSILQGPILYSTSYARAPIVNDVYHHDSYFHNQELIKLIFMKHYCALVSFSRVFPCSAFLVCSLLTLSLLRKASEVQRS